MIKNINDNLSEIFDVEPLVVIETKHEIVSIEETNNPVEDDTNFARQNIKELITKGNVAIDQLLEVAKQSEHPRAYEVASGLIKNLSDLNKDLLELQKRKNDLLPKSVTDSKNVTIDKAVFVGSTTELIKMIKQNKKEE